VTAVVEIPEGQHSLLGPSSSDRWLVCPGSVLATKDLPDMPTEFAAEGTAAHTLSEWCRVQNVHASTFHEQVLKVDGFEFTVDQEMIDSVQEFVDRVNEHPGVPIIEGRVNYTRWVPGGFGTLDHGSIDEPVARVTDLKYGKGVFVEAENNTQLMLYALGMIQDYWWVAQPDTFILAVHQPRRDYFGEWEITTKELIDWAWDIAKPAAELAMQPDAPFKAGDHCRFCKIRQTCKTRAAWVFEQTIGEFEDVDSVIDVEPRPPIELNDDQLARIWPTLSGIRNWCGDIEKGIQARLTAGQAVGGLKLVRGRSSRDFAPEAPEALPERLWAAGIDPYTLKSPAVLERELGKTGKDLIADLILTSLGKPTIAAADDKRAALNVTAETEFE